MIHEKGASCMAGTSRTLDRKLRTARAAALAPLEADYRVLLQMGIDVIETDLPVQVGNLLYADRAVPASRARYLRKQ
jgi:hypothetical protein